MAKLTTHVLDVYSGKPGKNIKVELYYCDKNDKKTKISSVTLNDDGRSTKALAEEDNFKIGKYEMVFFVGEYFQKKLELQTPKFLDEVVVRFGVSNVEENYHIPLLVSPWSYSTYRGS